MRNGVRVFQGYGSDLEADIANWLDAWPEREVTHTSTAIATNDIITHVVHYKEPDTQRAICMAVEEAYA
jgi:hypothetical protein